ncbi:MAG: serine/threonine-protein kinase [Paracoccaceae bacterium]
MTQVSGGGVPEGTTLNGMYELGKRIAMGGMGEVYIGKQIATGQKVAIKMILPEHANNDLILELFRKEANTLFDVYHEAIVRYFAFSVDPDLNRPYMAMEFAGGPALGDRLIEKGALSEDELTVLRKRIAGGLHAAHKKGVIHRDISSDNIILVHDKVEDAKIIDFGIAKSTTSEGTLIGSGFAGKLNYVSPEQLGLATGEVTAKSDIYSLGLVFAEAAVGRPLPMGGTHVEVTEKRRVVPDLSEVPIFVRPLLEWMLQPDPADRPADLEEVANWDAADSVGAVAAAPKGSAAGLHPRDRLREAQAGKGEKKKGTPWALIGLGGGAVAAAAVAGVVLLGPEQQQTPAPDGGTGTLIQDTGSDTVAALAAPSSPASVPPAIIGQTFDWSTPAFVYPGDKSALSITALGSMPPGLTFQPSTDGTSRIVGVPTTTGTYSVTILANGPGDTSARLPLQIKVERAIIALAEPDRPSEPTGGLTLPTNAPTDSGLSGLAPTTGDDGVSSAPLSTGATTPSDPTSGGALQAPNLTTGDTHQDTASAGPNITTSSVATLQPTVPSSGASSGISTGGSGSTEGLALPTTGGGTGLGTPSVTPGIGSSTVQPRDPESEAEVQADISQEPSVSRLSNSLLAPSPPGGNGGSTSHSKGSSGGTYQIQSTGGSAQSGNLLGPTQAPSDAGSNLDLAARPPSEAPTILNRQPAPLGLARNVPMEALVAEIFDESGAQNLSLEIDGFLPAGVAAQVTSEGRVLLSGTPLEYGSFPVRLAARDPDGQLSDAIEITLTVASTKDNLRAWRYISDYPGGTCTLSRPDVLTETSAIVEVFAAESAIDRIYKLNDDFIRDMGFEADFNVRLISEDQCPLIYALDQVGAAALDNALVITLTRDELSGNDRLEGKLQGGSGAKLFLYDSQGGLHDLSDELQTVGSETGFSIEMAGTGGQILIAAKPRPGATVDPSAGIERLLGAAQQGNASLALGYFTME